MKPAEASPDRAAAFIVDTEHSLSAVERGVGLVQVEIGTLNRQLDLGERLIGSSGG